MTEGRAAQAHRAPREGLLSKLAAAAGQLVLWIVFSLLFSIVIEWIGMALWWPEEGLAHSRRMLEAELGYLESDLRRSLVTSDPARFATRLAERVHHVLFEASRVDRIVEWARTPPSPLIGRMQLRFHDAIARLAPYVLAAMQVTEVFSVRLAVLTLSTPSFALFGLVAVVDGLVRRDLRRWGGGRESAFVYHWAKRAAAPVLVLAWVVYLSLPVSVSPVLVFLPFAALFALTVTTTASSFKKYL